MKKVILFFSFVFSSLFLFAQKEEWDKHFDKMDEADKLADEFYANPDVSKIPALKAAYDEVLSLIAQAESKSSDYREAAIYRKCGIYFNLGLAYEKIKDFQKEEEYANMGLAIWPYFSYVSQYAVEKQIKFGDANPMDQTYTDLIYLGVYSGFETKNYKRLYELEKLYEPVKKDISALNEWLIHYNIARTYDIEKNNNEKAEHWLIALEKWPAVKSEYKEKNKGPFDYMVKKVNGMSTNDNNVMLRAAHALYNVEKYTEADKLFGNYAKSASSPTLDAGWDYSESAMKEPDKTDARNAANIIEKHTSGFSEYEWERLQRVYEFIGDNAKVQEIKNKIIENRRKAEEERRLQAQRDEEERKRREKEERKRGARGRFSVAVSTNPFMYIWKDYPVALDIRIGRVINEFRVNFSNTTDKGDKYRFGQYKINNSSNTNPYHYSGMEYSYTLKILAGKMETKQVGRRNQIVGGYVGFQPRYAKYNFSAAPLTFQDSSAVIHTFNATDITASASRYEFSILAGFLGDNLGGFFHIDYYFGVGVGYRQLDISSTNNNAFDYNSYDFGNASDKRYDPERWNKFYVPVRFGFRIGINLL